MNGFALGLSLKRRLRATWKWAIVKHFGGKSNLKCALCLFQQWSVFLTYLEGVTTVALCALAMPEKTAHIPPPLLETAVILHGMYPLILQLKMESKGSCLQKV